MSEQITALGEHVILKAIAKSAGTDIESDVVPGLIIGVRETGEIPKLCEVYSIGNLVPKGFVEIGDLTPIPLGEKLNVMHPDVAKGTAKEKDRDEKFISVHWRSISCVYK